MNSCLRLAAILLSFLFAAPTAHALTIHYFLRFNNDDAATYVTQLVEGAAKKLKEQGQPDQAAKTIALFKTPGKTGGVYQFADALKEVNALNIRNSLNPNNRIKELEVEDAMARMLKDNGILVSAAYLKAVNQDFHPVGPPRNLANGT